MTLLLALETSSSRPAVALELDGVIVFDSTLETPDPSAQDAASLVRTAFARTGLSVSSVDALGVNIGPGGLSAVRTGVSLANALSFSIGKPVFGFNVFELAGLQVLTEAPSWPLLSVIPAAGGEVYAGLYEDGRLGRARFGALAFVVPAVLGTHARVAVAGRARARVAPAFPELEVFDSGIDAPGPGVLIEMIRRTWRSSPATIAQTAPLDENDSLFHDPTEMSAGPGKAIRPGGAV